ncbi:hypothetical protein R1flu_011939 [Riccia fluitans]|uniref:Uncharacterized protein n=1 Tax=Riccia fluitans TaxID=41844 RepID=A0ABD1Z973_9MARC
MTPATNKPMKVPPNQYEVLEQAEDSVGKLDPQGEEKATEGEMKSEEGDKDKGSENAEDIESMHTTESEPQANIDGDIEGGRRQKLSEMKKLQKEKNKEKRRRKQELRVEGKNDEGENTGEKSKEEEFLGFWVNTLGK